MNERAHSIDKKYNSLISIIVPIYNVGEYLETCIQSIIGQSYSNIEIILVDDGSTDESGVICDEYKLCDDRIIVLHCDNKGLVRTRKRGLEIAKGEFVVFVDGDDYIDKSLCVEMLERIQKYDVDFVHVNYFIDNEKKCNWIKENQLLEFNSSNNTDRPQIINEWILDETNINSTITPSLWSKIFKSDFIKKHYLTVPDNLCYGEDLICLLNMVTYCDSFYVDTGAWYHYRTVNNSMSRTTDFNKIVNQVHLFEYINEFLTKCGYGDDSKSALEESVKKSILCTLSNDANSKYDIHLNYLKNIEKFRNKRVIIYGAGIVGKDFYAQLSKYKDIEISGWVDRNTSLKTDYFEIKNPEEIKTIEFDYIIIASNNYKIVKSILVNLNIIGINRDKIVFGCE